MAGKSEAEARGILTKAGFSEDQIISQDVESDDVPEGAVVGTEPRAGSAVGAGEDIILKIAVPVPPEPTTSAPVSTSTSPLTPPAG